MHLQIIQRVVQGERSPRLDMPPLSNCSWNLIQSCWDHEASERPAMKDVVERMMAPARGTRNVILDFLLAILRDKKVRQC